MTNCITNDAKTKVYGNDRGRRRLAYEAKGGEGGPTHPIWKTGHSAKRHTDGQRHVRPDWALVHGGSMVWIPRSGRCLPIRSRLEHEWMVMGPRGSKNMLRTDGMGLAQQLELTTGRRRPEISFMTINDGRLFSLLISCHLCNHDGGTCLPGLLSRRAIFTSKEEEIEKENKKKNGWS